MTIFERLKSLPLTIVLTILIWMYAEAQVNSVSHVATSVSDIPVWVSAPPDFLSRYDILVEPATVQLTISGEAGTIDALRQKIASGTRDLGIHAFLDVSNEDRPSSAFATRPVRCVLPEGLAIQARTPDVSFRLEERKSASTPSTNTAK